MNKFLIIKSPINPNFSLKMGHLGPNLTTSKTIFNFGATRKTSPESFEDLLKNRDSDSSVQKIDPLKLLLLSLLCLLERGN